MPRGIQQTEAPVALRSIATSFSMLTVNADGHPVMGRFHRPGDEKRIVVVLEPEQFAAWLQTDVTQAQLMMVRPESKALVAQAADQVKADVQGGLF